MRKMLSALLVALLLFAGTAGGEETIWQKEKREKLTVGNPTPLTGNFFTGCWGETTSDLDVQDLLHGYSPVRWDNTLVRFRFDRSVVQNAVAMDDSAGNRTYLIVLYDDLRYSDGSPITAWDYAFSVLFRMDPVIGETGGTPADFSWMTGAEEYLSGAAKELAGLRVYSDLIFQLTVRADALPYFYELSRLDIHPYPIGTIAPGLTVRDDGQGAYLSAPLDAEVLRRTVLDGKTGYLTHPNVTSGPYQIRSYDGVTAVFGINPYYKGDEAGILPRIGVLTYTLAKREDMIRKLREGKFGLLNKVAESDAIDAGLRTSSNAPEEFSFINYPRTGLTMIWFCESSEAVQNYSVRKAIAQSIDRDGFIKDYSGQYGIGMDGFYGLGQWMYQLAAGLTTYEPEEETDQTAWEKISLEGLTRYSFDPDQAKALLDGREISLTFGIPDLDKTEEAVRKNFLPGLEAAGFRVTLQRLPMEDLQKAYEGELEGFDMIYLGEDFSIIFDPEVLKPAADPEENPQESKDETSLTGARAVAYQMAEEMVRTDPMDVLGFEQRWIALQEKITETLPLIPVYSNAYFDFYTRELHDYSILDAISWADAVSRSYISDREELQKGEKEAQIRDLNNMAEEYRIEPRTE